MWYVGLIKDIVLWNNFGFVYIYWREKKQLIDNCGELIDNCLSKVF